MAKSRIIGDPAGLGIRLSQLGDRVVKHVADVLRDESENIQQLARDNAPVDKGNLEEAIKLEEDRGGINRRLRVTVYVDPDFPAPEGSDIGRTVGRYMLMMHEGLAPYGSGAFKLGDKSQAKANAGFNVGGKFFERAYLERKPHIQKRVAAMVKRARKAGKL
ncbi:HK97 gp10 family phage protein [Castellaniella sp.]|uniref:HK97 gp10 family phage protein n=1 Tax=Castellaniella sp. TaxID=1955812 RepID=UPI002AFF87BE|nr:HK97 gp10 family phage protein [Castellaniella sp.]